MLDLHPAHPSELPDFRLFVLEQWKPGSGLFWKVAELYRKDNRVLPPVSDEWAAFEVGFDSYALTKARLYWVAAEMCDVIASAARTLPLTTLTKELVPCPNGFVFFERKLQGIAAADIPEYGEGIDVHALLWGTSFIPPGPHKALGIASYASFEQGRISPAGRTDWEWGQDTDAPIDEAISEDAQRIESMAEDRRWLATFFLLLSQEGIATETELRPPRQTLRRSERSNVSGEVRVVNVHAPKRAAASSGEASEVDWSHRWVVEGHWRQQAYGPKHSLRRPKFIAPFVKGPTDKPLIVKETVHVLKDA